MFTDALQQYTIPLKKKYEYFIKSDSKDIYNVTKIYILNICCSFELSIKNPENKKKHTDHKLLNGSPCLT